LHEDSSFILGTLSLHLRFAQDIAELDYDRLIFVSELLRASLKYIQP